MSFSLEFSDDALDRLADRLAERVIARLEVRREPVVYSAATLAEELGITPRAVRAAIDRGDLQAVRRGRGYVITAEAVAAWAAPGSPRARRSPAGAEVEAAARCARLVSRNVCTMRAWRTHRPPHRTCGSRAT